MATWSKVKRQLEDFLCPNLKKRVEYRQSGYRYINDKQGRNNITVDKKEIFLVADLKYGIRWYKNEQEVAKDLYSTISISEQEINQFKETAGADKIPEERIPDIIRKRKAADISKQIMAAQVLMMKSDFYEEANQFLTSPIEDSLNSDSIVRNVLALIDRRTGKSRLRKMQYDIRQRHPIVQYFYELRCEAEAKNK